uniref:NADAR domain-containing protein n=1 Tax=Globodera rostochiensis TaxID=31243 RepID=A0A914GZZ5_GLORO
MSYRDFAEYQGVPTTGVAAWNRLGDHTFMNSYQDFGSMSRDQGETALFQRPYSSKMFKLEGGGRYSRGQSLMQGMRGKRYQTMKSAENRRQQHTYPYTPVPDSMEHRDFPVSPDAVFNFHGYQSLFTLQHRFDFIVDGVSYKSVDQFYQMHKVKDLTGLESAKFTDGSTRNYSALAKELLRQANVKRSNIDNWRTGRGVEVIQKALLEKVRQCYDLRSAITSTADKLIVHSYNGDDFFGTGVPAKYVKDWCSGMEQNKVSLKYPMEFPLTGDSVKYVPVIAKGKNVLGAIYMILREKINKGHLDSITVSLKLTSVTSTMASASDVMMVDSNS